MKIETMRLTPESILSYSTVPISFIIKTRYVVERLRSDLGFRLKEEKVEPPQPFDYDVVDGEGPTRWSKQFDTSTWQMFLARQNDKLVGGAAIAVSAPGVFMLEGRQDMAVLWDIRVQPECRNAGIGTALFAEAAKWSKTKGCHQLKIETQNINVSACKFNMKYRRPKPIIVLLRL